MSGKEVIIVPPDQLSRGDVIECCIVGWGGLRAVVTVSGLASGHRPKNGPACAALGTLMQDFKDDDHTIEKAGTSVMVFWPGTADQERDARRVKSGDRPQLSIVLIEKSEDALGSDVDLSSMSTLDQLSALAAGLSGGGVSQSGGTKKELRNPEVMKLTVAYHSHVTCSKCGDGSRPCWYYPKADEMRCATHRDKSLQDPKGQPWEHETVVAWDDNPMDAHHYS